VAAKALTQLGLLADVTTGSQSPLVPLDRAEPSVKRNATGSSTRESPGHEVITMHVMFCFLTGDESLEIRVNADCLRLSPFPGREDARDMTRPDGIEDRGGRGTAQGEWREHRGKALAVCKTPTTDVNQ